MADNNFRFYRSRDPLGHGRDGAPAPARGQTGDPLAELARLIGQSDPMNDFGRDASPGPAVSLDDPARGAESAADDRYPEPNEVAHEGTNERHDERYNPPRLADVHPSYHAAPSSHDADYEPLAAGQFSGQRLRFDGARDAARGYPMEQPRYRDEQGPQRTSERPLPAFLPRSRDDRYEFDDQEQDGSDDQSYAADDYEEVAQNGRRRGGFVVIAAVLGLAVLGSAGAFTYRAMFGGSMLPSLPPIIKADNGPNKIMPNAGSSRDNNSGQADANGANYGEKLVSREEKPVDVPAPVNTAPRVISTIPIFPTPDSSPPGALASVTLGVATPMTPAPAASATPVPPAATISAAPPTVLPEPKKIRTVAIRPDQLGGADAAGSAPPPPPARTPSARPAAAAPAPVPRLASAPQPPAGANAPLSILPSQGDVPAPARTRIALAQPTSLDPSAAGEAPPSTGGGYAVQVTSQRSEAEAQTSFRALRAKYPALLSGREPIVRRADLGSKGVYYRALVGPFASIEQAAEMCSSLKAAGGNCIVQRN